MRNSVDIDKVHSRAMVREIGDSLRTLYKPDREPPPRIRDQLHRLRDLDGRPRTNSEDGK
ncbi:hypothetical protein JJB99_24200 [Bradyrhizobium diazoefficiens]|uniref:hypothetical protein n=1 Tax=Bradyrhizobium diazoefficiens TaxID=1355477 RepID=UPI001909FE35|nr:hypothetical protein [Bradyrhizobium diazoefficiens]QQO12556.1 hypothetical protein JJB99_24200 [Bradyrhizobium diazoefficiens]